MNEIILITSYLNNLFLIITFRFLNKLTVSNRSWYLEILTLLPFESKKSLYVGSTGKK